MNNQPPALTADNVTKTYGKGESLFTALDDVSLSIEKGESVAVIGKSGSGKSTLMHLMALMDKPTQGQITIDGKDANGLGKSKLNRLRNRTFGFVFQQFFLNGQASVLENVILPLKIAGVSSRERKRRGIEALRAVELEDKAKNKANDLSGGQKQRVVIARALINEPQIIFADEPTGNLDSATGQKVEDILFDLNAKHGITLIIVTHDEDLASRCQKQIHIKDGRVVAEEAFAKQPVRSTTPKAQPQKAHAPRRIQL
jgi:putative ABC transport system ATP-binding protein